MKLKNWQVKLSKPVLISGMLWWAIFVLGVLFVDPKMLEKVGPDGTYLPLTLVFFIALFLTIWSFERKIWRSLLWSFIISGFLVLRLMALGSLINGILLIIVGLSAEFYWLNSQGNP